MVLFFTLTQCSTPIEFYKYNLEKMRFFNIKKFEENKGKQDYDNEYHYKLLDRSEVREFSIVDNSEVFYIREISKKGSPFNYFYSYDENGNLFIEKKYFNNSILTHTEWDKNSKIVKEINYDRGFKHSFKQIRDIVLKEKNIDIYNTKEAIVDRFEPNKRTQTGWYEIHIFKTIYYKGELVTFLKENIAIIDETGEVITKESIKEKEQKSKSPSTSASQ